MAVVLLCGVHVRNVQPPAASAKMTGSGFQHLGRQQSRLLMMQQSCIVVTSDDASAMLPGLSVGARCY